MSSLVITPHEAAGATLGVQVTATLIGYVDGERVKVTGIVTGTDRVIVRPTSVRITELPFTIDLEENANIAPSNSRWLIDVGGDEFVIVKGAGSETLEDALDEDLVELSTPVLEQKVDAAVTAFAATLGALENSPAGTVPVPGGATVYVNEAGQTKQTAVTDLPFVEEALVDAKGDLVTATAADTPARLAVGSNGQVLVAASGQATGLQWGGASAISGFDTQVRTNRIDQMAAPTSTVTWAQQLNIDGALAGYGRVAASSTAGFGAASSWFSNSGHAQPRVAILASSSSAIFAMGPGNTTAVDWLLTYTGTAAAAITGSLSISAGLTVSGGSVSLPAGSVANGALATNPLARANHTGTQTASTISDFDTQVRTSRLDQMTAPTSALSWTVGLTVNAAAGVTVGDGTAADGKAVTSSSAFGAGTSYFGNTADAQPRVVVLASGSLARVMLGAGGATAPSWYIDYTSAALATITGGLVINGDLTLSARNIITDTTTGLKIGTAANQKVAFFGGPPVTKRTGWGAPTGTATRTTFVTSTVTLPQLAERVRGLIDDLTSLSLIGA